ncbi:MAG: amidohydrolase [Chloroflexi bacterium]|nr:amidohydrolase [Chloroflexota bacterium]
MKIDMHAHFIPRDCLTMLDSQGRPYGYVTRKDASGKDRLTPDENREGTSIPDYCDPERRLLELDRVGLDMQALSPSPRHIIYSLDGAEGLRLCQKYNDGIARVVRTYPSRFVGMATVPLQDMARALPELERAVCDLGLKGVEILSDVNGKNLDERELWPFYQKAQDLDILVYVHPRTPAQDNLKKYWLLNLVGHPFHTSLAIASVIFGGVLESFPRLRILFSHAGGAAPYLRGRWERAYQIDPACQTVPRPPGEYLRMLYFDSIALYDPALEYLVDTVGADRIVLGTDAPTRWQPDPITPVRNAVGISAADKERILEENSLALLKLEPQDCQARAT